MVFLGATELAPRGTELAPNFVSIGFAEAPSNFIHGRFLRLGYVIKTFILASRTTKTHPKAIAWPK